MHITFLLYQINVALVSLRDFSQKQHLKQSHQPLTIFWTVVYFKESHGITITIMSKNLVIPWYFFKGMLKSTSQIFDFFRSRNGLPQQLSLLHFLTFLWEDSTLVSFLRRYFLEQVCVFVICLSQLTNPNNRICVRCETSYNSYYPLDSFSFLLSSFPLFFSLFFPEQLVGMAYVVL